MPSTHDALGRTLPQHANGPAAVRRVRPQSRASDTSERREMQLTRFLEH